MARIGFIGVGRMGSGMAARLLAAGHDVAVYNRTLAKATPLREKGARVCHSARDAAVGAHAVIAMTADDDSSRAVWLGESGALAADLAPGTLAIECSTLSYDWVKELAAAAHARRLCYIDCPVTGLASDAAAGAITFLVGAEESDLEYARPVLAALSNRILHFGPVGCGTAYKLMINLMGAVQIAAAAEGMALAERAGLDLALVADAIASSQAASAQVVRNTRRIAAEDHQRDIAFTPVLRLKDVEYALRLARARGVATPFGQVARDAFEQLCRMGYGALNESKVIEVARSLTQNGSDSRFADLLAKVTPT
jgi:3-hydroxyisobutyrate dehydrogenase